MIDCIMCPTDSDDDRLTQEIKEKYPIMYLHAQ